MTQILIEYALVGLTVLLIPIGVTSIILGIRHDQQRRYIFGIGCVILSAILFWRTSQAEFWVVDRCLDAGGRYNYETQTCKFE